MKKIAVFLFIAAAACICAAGMSACTCPHNMVFHRAEDAACTQDGNYEYWECTKCGGLFADAEGAEELQEIPYIDAPGHDPVFVGGVEPDCLRAGIAGHYHCPRCGGNYADVFGEDELSDIVIPALGHQLTFVDAVAPACEEEGSAAHYHCSRCGGDYADEYGASPAAEISVPPLGHEWQLQDREYADDCLHRDIYRYVCANDSSHAMDLESGMAGDHSYFQGACSYCGIPRTEGLEYTAVSGGYSVTGAGSCTDERIYIPYIHNGLPVVSVGNEAFKDNTVICEVAMPDSVRSIGYSAFDGCTSLKEVRFGEGLISIGDLAFCDSAIERADLPDSLAGVNGFFRCEKLKSVSFGDGVKYIEDSAFQYCSSLKDVYIPGSVYEIDNFAFADCASLAKVKLYGYDTAVIQPFAFMNCPALVEADLGGGRFDCVSNSMFDGCTSLESVILPDTVDYIDYAAFEGCSSLKSIRLPVGLTSINSRAFALSGLESIDIPALVRSIDVSAFSGCRSLAEITVDEDNAVYSCVDNCIIERAEKLLVLGASASVIPSDGSVTAIGNLAFYGRTELKEIYISEHITQIDMLAFSDCGGLESITVAEANPVYSDINDMLVRKEDGYAFRACAHSVIPSDGTVVALSDSCFSGSAVKNVYIPACVTYVGQNCFSGCTDIERITVEEDNPNYYSAGDCLILREDHSRIDGVRYNVVIAGCVNSSIAEGVEHINYAAFRGCGIESIDIAPSLKTIDFRAFEGCSRLTQINYGGTTGQWLAVEKGQDWDQGTGEYVVQCTDGAVSKSGEIMPAGA